MIQRTANGLAPTTIDRSFSLTFDLFGMKGSMNMETATTTRQTPKQETMMLDDTIYDVATGEAVQIEETKENASEDKYAGLYDDEDSAQQPLTPKAIVRRRHVTLPPVAPVATTPALKTTQPLPQPRLPILSHIQDAWTWAKKSTANTMIAIGILVLFGAAFIAVEPAIYTSVVSMQRQMQHGQVPTYRSSVDLGRKGGASDLVAYVENGTIAVIETMPDHSSKMYTLSTGIKRDMTVVSSTVVDVNGDNKPDILLTLDGSTQSPTLLNTGNGLQWLTSSEEESK